MKKIYYTWTDVEKQTQSILQQLAVGDWRPDYVVGLTRGGLVPAVMISQYLGVPMHALHVSLRDNEKDCESNLWMAEDAYGYLADPKKILIVDDINDSGATLNWIKRDWEGGCLPGEEDRWHTVWSDTTRFAVLVDNQASEFGGINYSAEEINKAEEDCWIVFPWEEWWR